MGLTQSEVFEKLKQFGFNEIQRETSRSPWKLAIEQFRSPLVLILIFACVLSAALGESTEAYAIGVVLFINAFIGFFQEYRAETAILALQKMTAPKAKVIRDGRQAMVPAREVVPSDILLLEAGDIIAADARVIEASHLQVNEAILTGESLPVEKIKSEAVTGDSVNHGDRSAMNNCVLEDDQTRTVFMGTSVVTGASSAQVIKTGMATELGKIAHLISTAEIAPTPLQSQLLKLGHSLLLICLAVVALVLVIGFTQGKSWLELLIFSVSLAVAAVPEGMPAIVTVALALGVQRLAARNALIRKLPSVETLGSVSVICTDKTGTLTTGEMRVRELWGEDHSELLRAGVACCDAELNISKECNDVSTDGIGDPTEIAILIAARERGIEKAQIEKSLPRLSMEAFDSDRKRMSILRSDGINYVKGAIEKITPLCNSNPLHLESARKAAIEMSSRGLRTLAIAVGKGKGENKLHLLGVIGIADPPRTEVRQAIKEARGAGILSVMITGDHPNTAAAIARELGLVLKDDPLQERVYARATPEDKLKLVRKWKGQGAIVAMTGDGVNDAPALREAHIGIAMGKGGTEVTRQAADLILADDNFATIVVAIKEGRNIFKNIRNSIIYLLTGNLAEVVIVLVAMIMGLPLPLLAIHLLWINLVTDVLPALTLIVEPLSPQVMSRPPRPSTENLLGRAQWIQILWMGLLEAFVCMGLFFYLLKEHSVDYARSMMLTTLVLSQIFRIFGSRSKTRLFWEVGVLSNLWLLGVALLTGLLQVSLHFFPLTQRIFGLQPLSLGDFFLILPLALVAITTMEIKKMLIRLTH